MAARVVTSRVSADVVPRSHPARRRWVSVPSARAGPSGCHPQPRARCHRQSSHPPRGDFEHGAEGPNVGPHREPARVCQPLDFGAVCAVKLFAQLIALAFGCTQLPSVVRGLVAENPPVFVALILTGICFGGGSIPGVRSRARAARARLWAILRALWGLPRGQAGVRQG